MENKPPSISKDQPGFIAITKELEKNPEEKRAEKYLKKPPETRMNLKLFAQNFKGLSEEEINDKIMSLDKLHLEYKGIKKIENLDLFCNLTHLYLQGNKIISLDGIQEAPMLKVLNCRLNEIKNVSFISNLKLESLNIGQNKIEYIELSQLPPTLIIFSYELNPLKQDIQLKDLVSYARNIQEINRKLYSAHEKAQILGILSPKLIEYQKKVAHIGESSKENKNDKNFDLINFENEIQALRLKTLNTITRMEKTFELEKQIYEDDAELYKIALGAPNSLEEQSTKSEISCKENEQPLF